MDSVRLVVNGYDCGMFSASETGLSTTWQTKLVTEVNTFANPIVKTLKLPLTKELKIALGNVEELDSDSYDNSDYVPIEIYVTQTRYVRAWLKFIRIVIEEYSEYIECSCSPREKGWVEAFGQFTMNEVDWSDVEHELTVAEIRSSETYSLSVPYVYAPVDIGEITRLQVLWVDQSGGNTDFYYYGEQVSALSFYANTYGFDSSSLIGIDALFNDVPSVAWNAKGIYIARTTAFPSASKLYEQKGFMFVNRELFNWQVGDFYPLIRIHQAIYRAFAHIGYQVDIPDFLLDKYHFWHNVEALNGYEKEYHFFRTKVIDDGFVFAGYTGPKYGIIMPFMNNDNYGYKSNTNYDDTDSDDATEVFAGTNLSKYVADEDQIVRFRWDYDIEVQATGTSAAFWIRHYASGGSLIRDLVEDIQAPAATGVYRHTGTYHTSYTYLEAGDYVQCELDTLFAGTTTLRIAGGNSFESIMYEGGNYKNKTIRLNEYFPEETALRWIKDIAMIHNLDFYTNELLKKVYIVPDDEKPSGKQIPFDKINREKQIEIEEIKDYHPNYEFNWKKDNDDWAVDFIEVSTGERWSNGTIDNPSVFVTETDNVELEIYAATFDKFEASQLIGFKTVEMKNSSTWPDKPHFKRVDYKPRYLTVTFGQDLQSNLLPQDGEPAGVYSIEGDSTPSTYPFVEFQMPFSTLITSHYVRFVRKMKYGVIVRVYAFLNESDIDFIANILESDNDFRADYIIQIKGVERKAELVKIIDYSPGNQTETRIEFVVIKEKV